MHAAQLTDERLCSWLDTNQLARERLCADLLPLVGAYTDVTSRRPRGGRDGARDLEALYDGRIEVWGAVTFRNSANDSKEHRQATIKKFKTDLADALTVNKELNGFVFLTNVDLTPSQIDSLIEHSTGLGLDHVEVVGRERLRQALDSPKGYLSRLRYLDIEMSKEEQLTYLQHITDDMKESVAGDMGILSKQMQAVEFRQASTQRANVVFIIVGLKEDCSPADLGHFRISYRISKRHRGFPASGELYTNLCITGRDAYGTYGGEAGSKLTFGFSRRCWLVEEPQFQSNTSEWYPSCLTRQFRLEVELAGIKGFQTISDFDQSSIYPAVTQPLIEKLAFLGLGVDDYVLAGAPIENFRDHSSPQFDKWPKQLDAEEAAVPWATLTIRVHDPSKPPPLHPNPDAPGGAWNIDFKYCTPRRVVDAGQIDKQQIGP